jgi:hypothetical protein
MAGAKTVTKKSLPGFTIDKSLAKYKDMPLFEGKVEEANEILKKTGLPRKNEKTPRLPKNTGIKILVQSK